MTKRDLILVGFVAALMVLVGVERLQAQQMHVELVFLRDGGLFPSKITRPAGRFLLVVKNRSHAKTVSLGITGPGASVIAAVEDLNDLNHDYVLTLTAESYVLKDSAHPSWTPLTIVLQ